jgi:hypothetical protein
VFSPLFVIAALLFVLEHEAHLVGMPVLLLILLVELVAVSILFFRSTRTYVATEAATGSNGRIRSAVMQRFTGGFNDLVGFDLRASRPPPPGFVRLPVRLANVHGPAVVFASSLSVLHSGCPEIV